MPHCSLEEALTGCIENAVQEAIDEWSGEALSAGGSLSEDIAQKVTLLVESEFDGIVEEVLNDPRFEVNFQMMFDRELHKANSQARTTLEVAAREELDRISDGFVNAAYEELEPRVINLVEKMSGDTDSLIRMIRVLEDGQEELSALMDSLSTPWYRKVLTWLSNVVKMKGA